MVGIVIVSHSYQLAEGVKELAEQMGQGRVHIAAAGGLDEENLGTNIERVLSAFERVYQPDGVLVLMDLGSAVLTTRLAIEMLPEDWQQHVRLSNAPIVEGAVAAAVEAAAGHSLDEISRAAAAVIQYPKLDDEEAGGPGLDLSDSFDGEANTGKNEIEQILEIKNPMGLHARPAALFVEKANEFEASVQVKNLDRNVPEVDGKSLFGLLSLGARAGNTISIRSKGGDAEKAVTALAELVDSGLGEPVEGISGESPLQDVKTAPVPVENSPIHGEGGKRKSGIGVSAGIVIAPVLNYEIGEVVIDEFVVEDVEAEYERFVLAVERTRRQFIDQKIKLQSSGGVEAKDILSTYSMFLEDVVVLKQVETLIKEQHKNAEAAFFNVIRKNADHLLSMDDEVFRQRAVDVEDIGRRVIRNLQGHVPQESKRSTNVNSPVVLIAKDIAPADFLEFDKDDIAGICLTSGSQTSHISILAQSLEIPAVVGTDKEILNVVNGTEILLDGEEGSIYLEPDETVKKVYFEKQEAYLEKKKNVQGKSHQPAVTRDEKRVFVGANASDLSSVRLALDAGADGVGLLRTEFLFLNRNSMPDEDEQYKVYKSILDYAGDTQIIFRTLDIGGDKQVSYLNIDTELNPFLGVRAIRLGLRFPDILRVQLRAILRAAGEKNIGIMFPMITLLDELQEAKRQLFSVQQELGGQYIAPSSLEIGMMVETPAAAINADVFAPELDFFSIGTNDLVQYTMASDRTNEEVSYLNQPMNLAILRLIKNVVEAARKHDKWVGICGDIAGDENATPVLVGLGVNELSVVPTRVPFIKEKVRLLSVTEEQKLLQQNYGL